MSTTKEFKVEEGSPYSIKIRANGKYDYKTTHTFTKNNEQLSYTMEYYDGLKYTLNSQGDVGTPILDFSETVLPWKFEMNNYLARTRYCWKPYREEPYQVEILKLVPTNYESVGNLTFNGNMVSGFTDDDYLKLKKAFNPKGTWEVVFKVRLNEVKHQGLFGYKGDGLFRIVLSAENKLLLGLSTVTNDFNIGVIDGITSLLTNTDYWIKAEFTGTAYNLYLSTNGTDYNLEGTLETSSIPVFPETTTIGTTNREGIPFDGSIDLSKSYIKLYEMSAEGEGELIEYAFTQPTLSENGTMGGSSFAVSADNKTNGRNPAYYAFDDNTNNYWRGGNVPGYIEFYNPAPINVTALTWGFFYSYPTSGNVQGSNDYSDWTTITDFTNDSASDFTIDMSGNTNSYKYYRINVSAVNMDVIHCKNLTIVGTVKGYAVENIYKLNDKTYAPNIIKNYTANGSVLINDGIASGFGYYNYLTLNESFKPEGAWEIGLKINVSSLYSNEQGLFGYDSSGLFKLCLSGENKLILSLSRDTGSWNIGEIVGTTSLELNKDYWIKAEFTGNMYNLYLSTDGTDYNLEGYLETTEIPVFPDTTYIGIVNYNRNHFRGIIDLSESYVEYNGNKTYLYSRVTEELYGIIDGEEYSVYQPSYCYVNKDQNLIIRQNKIEKINDITDWYLGEIMKKHPDYDLDV